MLSLKQGEKLTVPFLRAFNPCEIPEWMPESWAGTLLEVLKDARLDNKQKLWVAYLPGVLSYNIRYAVACTLGPRATDEQVLKLLEYVLSLPENEVA
jgi:hypothetical protein